MKLYINFRCLWGINGYLYCSGREIVPGTSSIVPIISELTITSKIIV